MGSEITLTINGKRCAARVGQTVLEACRENGVAVPTLCHDPRLAPFGSCMICRVEIAGERGAPLACGALARDGMVVATESAAIGKSRKTCLELLLSQHRGDCEAPCSVECPAHTDVQGYVNLIAKGEHARALRLVKETNPLPVVCGRICTRPCEEKCRRNVFEGGLGIAHLKRFVADLDLKSGESYLPEKKGATGKKAAIIGAGPAGLSAAWFLALEGHGATIFERQESPGGMLRYGIPAYRMPRETLDAEIDVIKSLGVEIACGAEFGKDVTIKSLKAAGYGAILLAVGSQIGYPLGVAGEEGCPGVLIGVDFLGMASRGRQPDFAGKRIAVVGGGNTAMDCARTALRLGARSVSLVYRRTLAQMPADKTEIEEARHEGVEFLFLTNPLSVSQSGETVSMTLTKMELGEPDASGRRSPRPVAGSEHVLEAEYVISAIGQTQDLRFVGEDCDVAVERERLAADASTAMTSAEGVFAAGDAVSGPQTAILAIAGGRRAAMAMSRYLNGQDMESAKSAYNHVKAKNLREIDPASFGDVERIEKAAMPVLEKGARLRGFDEVELGLSEEQAKREAARCLSCGCADAGDCKLREHATEYGADQFAFGGECASHLIDNSHKHISRDKNKCILCGLCARICAEAGSGVFGFVGRGFGATVEPSFSMPLGEDESCTGCGLCVSACPTGALTPRGDELPTSAYRDRAGALTGIADAVAQAKMFGKR